MSRQWFELTPAELEQTAGRGLARGLHCPAHHPGGYCPTLYAAPGTQCPDTTCTCCRPRSTG